MSPNKADLKSQAVYWCLLQVSSWLYVRAGSFCIPLDLQREYAPSVEERSCACARPPGSDSWERYCSCQRAVISVEIQSAAGRAYGLAVHTEGNPLLDDTDIAMGNKPDRVFCISP